MRFRARFRVAAVFFTLALGLTGALAGVALAGGDHHGTHRHGRDRHGGASNDQSQCAALQSREQADHGTPLPVDSIQSSMHAQGSVTDGVLTIPLDRTDITGVKIGSVPILPSFEINGEMAFQPIGNCQALLNGDIALKPSELDPFIAAILKNGLTFQAEHQHMYDFNPMVWFVHVRGQGDPVQLAAAIYNALSTTTSTPFPQAPPSNPTTPLDAQRLEHILHGFDVQVGDNGVVTVYVARRDQVSINGIPVNPATNIATNIAFEPLDSTGATAAVMPDFSMEAGEINNVISTMSGQGWGIGCLYNQETAETPQLYFSHDFKVGDPYQLAQEIRNGLDQMNSQ